MMYSKIHAYTTDRIDAKTAALLSVYVVTIELLARSIGITALLAYDLVIQGNTEVFSTLPEVPLFAIAYGLKPIGYGLLAANSGSVELVAFLIPFAAFGYLVAVGVVYVVHRKYA